MTYRPTILLLLSLAIPMARGQASFIVDGEELLPRQPAPI